MKLKDIQKALSRIDFNADEATDSKLVYSVSDTDDLEDLLSELQKLGYRINNRGTGPHKHYAQKGSSKLSIALDMGAEQIIVSEQGKTTAGFASRVIANS